MDWLSADDSNPEEEVMVPAIEAADVEGDVVEGADTNENSAELEKEEEKGEDSVTEAFDEEDLLQHWQLP
jgi:hypothetical protein